MTLEERIQSRIEFLRQEQKNGKILQLTTFNITGLMITHLLKKYHIEFLPVFIDTFYHFEETYQYLNEFPYSVEVIHTNKAKNRNDFERKYGEELWKKQPERYAYYTKILPMLDIYQKVSPIIVLNGRRRSQGGERKDLELFSKDAYTDIPKMQLLYDFTEEEILTYLRNENVKIHPLYEKGYRSIGDFHSTFPSHEENKERSGRIFHHSSSECGLHVLL